MDNEKHYLPQMLRVYGDYQNGNHHFYTIKRYDCLVGDQNDHQLKSVRYGWVVSGQFVHIDSVRVTFDLDLTFCQATVKSGKCCFSVLTKLP